MIVSCFQIFGTGMPYAAVNCVLRQPVLAGEPTQRSATREGFLRRAGVGTVMRVAETDPQPPHFDADGLTKDKPGAGPQ